MQPLTTLNKSIPLAQVSMRKLLDPYSENNSRNHKNTKSSKTISSIDSTQTYLTLKCNNPAAQNQYLISQFMNFISYAIGGKTDINYHMEPVRRGLLMVPLFPYSKEELQMSTIELAKRRIEKIQDFCENLNWGSFNKMQLWVARAVKISGVNFDNDFSLELVTPSEELKELFPPITLKIKAPDDAAKIHVTMFKYVDPQTKTIVESERPDHMISSTAINAVKEADEKKSASEALEDVLLTDEYSEDAATDNGEDFGEMKSSAPASTIMSSSSQPSLSKPITQARQTLGKSNPKSKPKSKGGKTKSDQKVKPKQTSKKASSEKEEGHITSEQDYKRIYGSGIIEGAHTLTCMCDPHLRDYGLYVDLSVPFKDMGLGLNALHLYEHLMTKGWEQVSSESANDLIYMNGFTTASGISCVYVVLSSERAFKEYFNKTMRFILNCRKLDYWKSDIMKADIIKEIRRTISETRLERSIGGMARSDVHAYTYNYNINIFHYWSNRPINMLVSVPNKEAFPMTQEKFEAIMKSNPIEHVPRPLNITYSRLPAETLFSKMIQNYIIEKMPTRYIIDKIMSHDFDNNQMFGIDCRFIIQINESNKGQTEGGTLMLHPLLFYNQFISAAELQHYIDTHVIPFTNTQFSMGITQHIAVNDEEL